MNDFDLDKCCRTCLQIKRPNKMKLLSTKWKDSLSLADMLVDIAKMSEDNILSDCGLQICSTCEQDMITAYNFKMVCQNTEQILANRFMPQIEEIKLEAFKEDLDTDETITEAATDVCKVVIQPKPLPKKRIRKPRPTSAAKTKPKEGLAENNIENDQQQSIDEAATPIVTKKKRRKKQKPSLYCKRCDIKFATNREYMRHREDVHWTSYPCTICGKLILEHRLANHMLSHSDEKNFVCTLCGNRFTYTSGLKEHMRIHTGEKRYKCDFCDERFIHWNSKKNHIYMKHTKEKKLVYYRIHCSIVSNSYLLFIRKSNAYILGLQVRMSLLPSTFPAARLI